MLITCRATALAKLADPEGEVALTRAAHNQGIIQMMPTLGSCSLEVNLNIFTVPYTCSGYDASTTTGPNSILSALR